MVFLVMLKVKKSSNCHCFVLMMTFFKLKRNATNLPQTGQSVLGTNKTLVAAAWRMIYSKAKEVLVLSKQI